MTLPMCILSLPLLKSCRCDDVEEVVNRLRDVSSDAGPGRFAIGFQPRVLFGFELNGWVAGGRGHEGESLR